MSQKRASRAGIQPAKPVCPLESIDVKKDGTIADLKLRLAPKPSLPRHQHARREYEQDLTSSSYRDPVHQSALERQEWNRASRTFAPRPLWESSWCLRGSLVFCRNRPWILWKTKVWGLKTNRIGAITKPDWSVPIACASAHSRGGGARLGQHVEVERNF